MATELVGLGENLPKNDSPISKKRYPLEITELRLRSLKLFAKEKGLKFKDFIEKCIVLGEVAFSLDPQKGESLIVRAIDPADGKLKDHRIIIR